MNKKAQSGLFVIIGSYIGFLVFFFVFLGSFLSSIGDVAVATATNPSGIELLFYGQLPLFVFLATTLGFLFFARFASQ